MSAPANFLKLRGIDATQTRTQDNINGTLAPVAAALGATPIMGAPPPAWIRPDILNGYGQLAAPLPLCAYHKDALGYVHTKIALDHAAGAVAGTVAFVYGSGYRPSETLTFSGCDAAGVLMAMTLDSAGNLSNLAALAAADTVRMCFSFLAEA